MNRWTNLEGEPFRGNWDGQSLPRVSKWMNIKAGTSIRLAHLPCCFPFSWNSVLEAHISQKSVSCTSHQKSSDSTNWGDSDMIPHPSNPAKGWCWNHVTVCGLEAQENNLNHISGNLGKVACQKREAVDHTPKRSVQWTLEMRGCMGFSPKSPA